MYLQGIPYSFFEWGRRTIYVHANHGAAAAVFGLLQAGHRHIEDYDGKRTVADSRSTNLVQRTEGTQDIVCATARP